MFSPHSLGECGVFYREDVYMNTRDVSCVKRNDFNFVNLSGIFAVTSCKSKENLL